MLVYLPHKKIRTTAMLASLIMEIVEYKCGVVSSHLMFLPNLVNIRQRKDFLPYKVNI